MQTLPFLAAKISVAKNTAEPAPSKQNDVQGTPFTEVLSKQKKQISKDDAHPANNPHNTVNKKNDRVLQEKSVQEDIKEEDGRLVVEQNVPDNLLVETTEVDKEANDKTTAEKPVDAQQLAQEAIAKTLQEVTDGKVILAVPQINVEKPVEAPRATAEPAVTVTTKNTKGDVPSVGLTADTDAKGKVSADSTQPALNAQTEGQQLENDKFVQTMIAESKMKSGQEVAINKAIAGAAETSAIATVSLQQPAAKFSATPLQLGSSNTINAYPGKTGWNEAVSQKIVWMVGATEQSAKLTLNPPELGPLEVIIRVNNEKADATFISENPEVRRALEDGVSTLRHLMGQAGVELGQANVNTSKQQQEFQQFNREQFARQQTANTSNQTEESVKSNPVVVRASNGLVDTFA